MAEPLSRCLLRDSATQEVRTVQAARFSRLKRTAAFAGGPAVAALVLFAPSLELPRDAQVLAAILTWVVLYWVVEPIPLPVTGVLGAVLCVMVGLGSFRTVFAPYAHPIMFLLIGSLLLAEAVTVHGGGWTIRRRPVVGAVGDRSHASVSDDRDRDRQRPPCGSATPRPRR
ncbi:MAG: hypothetical protein KatS3mg082_1572 [Nitrospiraceae bacterium]|nr:MAG: hypothetical protein KatS3mg082_1572 [Nitrospiraceae bacterium]